MIPVKHVCEDVQWVPRESNELHQALLLQLLQCRKGFVDNLQGSSLLHSPSGRLTVVSTTMSTDRQSFSAKASQPVTHRLDELHQNPTMLTCRMSSQDSMSCICIKSMYLSCSLSSDSCTLLVTLGPEKSAGSPATYFPTFVATIIWSLGKSLMARPRS